MITEEIKVQTQKQVEREKESKRRSRERKRSWDPDTYTLGKGIVEEDQVISISEDSSPEEMLKAIQYLKKQNEMLRSKLREKITLDDKQIQKFCNKNGFKSFQAYLKNVNAINAAEKGKLYNQSK